MIVEKSHWRKLAETGQKNRLPDSPFTGMIDKRERLHIPLTSRPQQCSGGSCSGLPQFLGYRNEATNGVLMCGKIIDMRRNG